MYVNKVKYETGEDEIRNVTIATAKQLTVEAATETLSRLVAEGFSFKKILDLTISTQTC